MPRGKDFEPLIDWKGLGDLLRRAGFGASAVSLELNLPTPSIHSVMTKGVEPNYTYGHKIKTYAESKGITVPLKCSYIKTAIRASPLQTPDGEQ